MRLARLLASGEFAAAETLLETLAGERPQDFAVWNNLGAVRDKLEQPDKAVEAYRRRSGRGEAEREEEEDSQGQSHTAVAPLSLVISAFAPVEDIRSTLTPDLKPGEDTRLLLIDLRDWRHSEPHRALWAHMAAFTDD